MRVSELAAVEDTLPRPKPRCVGNAGSTRAEMHMQCAGRERDAERRSALTGRSASLSLLPDPFRGPAREGAYSCGGTTILSLPIVTIRKSSRRFCCQQASLCSVQTGRSSP